MQLDADDLLAQIRQDYPMQYEISSLRLLATKQAAEIDRLTALVPPASPYKHTTYPAVEVDRD